MIHIFRTIADWIGRYERLRCPHCDLQIRFRGVSGTEAEYYQTFMANHVKQHATT